MGVEVVAFFSLAESIQLGLRKDVACQCIADGSRSDIKETMATAVYAQARLIQRWS